MSCFSRFILLLVGLVAASLEARVDSNVASLARGCLAGEISLCESLLSPGIPSPSNCGVATCNLIGSVLSLANREAEAIAYLKPACKAKHADSCFGLGLGYESMGDYANARLSYQQACEGGHAASCHNLAMLYARNDLSRQDYTSAARLFLRACKLLYAKACFNMAVLHARGMGVAEDLSLTRFYFDRSCALGLKEACKHAKDLKDDAIPPPLPKKTRGYYDQGF